MALHTGTYYQQAAGPPVEEVGRDGAVGTQFLLFGCERRMESIPGAFSVAVVRVQRVRLQGVSVSKTFTLIHRREE